MKQVRLLQLFLALGGAALLACSSPSTDHGLPGSGGASAAGGGNGAGGVTAGGGAGAGGPAGAGGSLSVGGSLGTGGETGSGGVSSAGGRPGAGGAHATGGDVGSGGRAATGGMNGGGATGAGGVSAAGGREPAGGSSGTDAAAGAGGRIDARPGTGGSPATGGVTGSGGATVTDASSGAGGSSPAGPWQIMPLGDSITGTTCYPKLLAQELVSKGHTNFAFVGTVLNNQGCGSAPNVQTEGHGGYLVTYLTTDSPSQGGKGTLTELKSWAAEQPEVVLMEYGTNDAWSSVATSSILDAYGVVVDQFRSQKPDVIFFVAQITPLNPSGCTNCEANVEALNAQIPGWAAGKSTAASPIYVVDIWSSLPAATYTPNSTYTSDGCHPNPAGSQLMADAWYAGLVAEGIP